MLNSVHITSFPPERGTYPTKFLDKTGAAPAEFSKLLNYCSQTRLLTYLTERSTIDALETPLERGICKFPTPLFPKRKCDATMHRVRIEYLWTRVR